MTPRTSVNLGNAPAFRGLWRRFAPARRAMWTALAGFVLAYIGTEAKAQRLLDKPPAEQVGTGLFEKRGAKIPLDLQFTDSKGKRVRLGDYFDGKRPVVLILGYYTCPMQCTLILNNLQKTLNELPFTLGKEYLALCVSFDHRNTSADAASRQAVMIAGYDRPVLDSAWPFLTGDAESARSLADSVGYKYVFLPKSGEFSHPSAIVILEPDGVVSNYLKGVAFPEKQLRLALMDAAAGKIGGVFDGFLSYCYHYDPSSGSYTLQAVRVMQIAGVITVVFLGGTIGGLLWAGARRRARDAASGAGVGLAKQPTLRGEPAARIPDSRERPQALARG